MFSAKRKLQLLEILDNEGMINVRQAAKKFNTSEATIRRDLDDLEKEKLVKRVYGGAVKGDAEMITPEFDNAAYADLDLSRQGIKSRICMTACNEINDGEFIYLDGGTSVAGMIYYLANRPVTIITNNMLIIQSLKVPVARIIILGGTYNRRFRISEGPEGMNVLRQYNFDRCYIGTTGIDMNTGYAYVGEMPEKEIKSIAMENSTNRYLMMDDSKFGVKDFCKLAPIESFTKIYCNQPEGKSLGNYPKNIEFVK